MAIWADVIARSKSALALGSGVVTAAVTLVWFARAAAAGLTVDREQVRILNPFRTITIPRRVVSGARIGRYKLLGCVLMLDLHDGRRIHVFGVQGITGQPHRKSSIEAYRVADLLNQEFAKPPHTSALG